MASIVRYRFQGMAFGTRTRRASCPLCPHWTIEGFWPSLGRPQVDTLKGSRLVNLKELRIQHRGEPWRVLFVFDPKRRAILLVGGNKQGDARWYKRAIALAEERYQRHLEEMEKANGRDS